MRIAIDIRSLMDGRLSGVEVYTINIIRALLKYAPQHEYHLFYNAAQAVRLPDFGQSVQLHAFRYPNKLLNASQWLLNKPRWDALVSADCFFVPSLRLMPLSLEKPLVTTVHDISYEHFPHFFSSKRRLWHHMMRTRTLLERSDHLIAVSEATARDIHDVYKIDPTKISVIYSGITLDTARSINIQKKYKLPEKYILFMATLEPRKNVISIIRAFSAIAHLIPQHLIIGGARGWLTKDIDTALAQSVARERIHVRGFIAEKDKATVYSLADLFVYPSFYEGFGFPPLEALACGTPVVTSYNSSLPEVVGQWATLIDPYDPTELAAVLQQFLVQPRRVSGTVQQIIYERYSWEKTARHTVQVIESVV